jgi:hypothetical protein
MENSKKQYYYEMAKRDRLIPLTVNNKLGGFLTFYIGNGDVSKYVRDDMWSVLDDEPKTGTVCYIDHLIGKDRRLSPHAVRIWHNIKKYIGFKYPQVQIIRWNRFKNNKHFTYIINIQTGGRQCIKYKS